MVAHEGIGEMPMAWVFVMSFDQATRLAAQRFYNMHPLGSLPGWVDSSVTVGCVKEKDGRWRIEYSLCPKMELGDNEFWGDVNGKRALMKLDQKTGQRRVVISRTQSTPAVVIFSVLVRVEDGDTFVVSNCDLSAVDGALCESYR